MRTVKIYNARDLTDYTLFKNVTWHALINHAEDFYIQTFFEANIPKQVRDDIESKYLTCILKRHIYLEVSNFVYNQPPRNPNLFYLKGEPTPDTVLDLLLDHPEVSVLCDFNGQYYLATNDEHICLEDWQTFAKSASIYLKMQYKGTQFDLKNLV